METHTKEVLVFRVKKVSRGADTWFYLRNAGTAYNNGMCADPLEAKDFTGEPTISIVNALDNLSKSTETIDDYALVHIKIVTEITAVDLNTGQILEERRRQALAKLTPMEIEALGIQRLATYDKVKFHGK